MTSKSGGSGMLHQWSLFSRMRLTEYVPMAELVFPLKAVLLEQTTFIDSGSCDGLKSTNKLFQAVCSSCMNGGMSTR
uniref:Uncharacterized protein n=1 Tax=Trichuris muris TaxID=70415 RepID=A0A5S6QEV4_TRIMR